MRALVVFETMFGNTAAIGEAVAVALRAQGVEAEAEAVTRIDPSSTGDVDLLVVGGPTHAHGMSRAATRRAGAGDRKNEYPDPTIDPGLREWLERIPPGRDRTAAAFDTRFDKPEWLTGSAAKGIGKRLLRHGFRLAADPESFFVTNANTLEVGEEAHAERWGTMLATRIPSATKGVRPS